MKLFSSIIFDLDGTLIDSSDGVVDAVNYSLREFGEMEQPAERIKRYIGYPLSQMYREFTDAPADGLYRHFRSRAAQTVVSSTVMLDGVDEVLKELRRTGYRLAIATTKIRSHVDGIVAKFGWGALFGALVGGDEVERVKPAPDAFVLALNRLKAGRQETVVVGDTINDVEAARAVPMTVIAVNSLYGGSDEVRAAGPDSFVESISELPEVLRSLSLTEDNTR